MSSPWANAPEGVEAAEPAPVSEATAHGGVSAEAVSKACNRFQESGFAALLMSFSLSEAVNGDGFNVAMCGLSVAFGEALSAALETAETTDERRALRDAFLTLFRTSLEDGHQL